MHDEEAGDASPHGAARDLWRAVSDLISDVVLQARTDGTIVFVNRAPSGVAASALIGRNVVDLVTAPFRADVRRCLASVAAGEPARRRLLQIELPDGRRSWYATTTVPVAQEDRITGVTVAARDLALRHSLGAASSTVPAFEIGDHWRQVQRLELVGLLAGGLVHDFKNVLAAIGSSVELLLEAIPQDHDMWLDVENVQRAVKHGSAVAQRLLELARGQSAKRERLDLNDVVTDVTAMARLFLDGHVRLETHLDPTGAPVVAHRSEMEQVLFNLLLNARDAMPPAGGKANASIVISTRRLVYTAATAPRNCKLRGTVVRLRVEDTGAGIDDMTRERVFEPFFTTKAPERGTGLGLSTVDAIVKDSGGCVELASRVGAGTTVDVVIPDADRLGLCAA
jgi:two-component system, cell cycle sensor histidine kinase and response regulator CckA